MPRALPPSARRHGGTRWSVNSEMTLIGALVRLARLAALTTVACLPLACTHGAPTTSEPASGDFLGANMNPSVDPGVDFFEYANGGWLKRNPIPASESNWGIGKVVREQLYLNLRKINEQSASGENPAGSDRQKIGDFW